MSAADLSVAFFAACNALRILAYAPQILAIGRDKHGATAISFTTWILFGVSNASTSIYAIVAVDDITVAIVFAASAFCCGVILLVTAYKRLTYAPARAPAPFSPNDRTTALLAGIEMFPLHDPAR